MDKKDSLDFIVIIILILIIDRNMICVSFCIAYQECTPNIQYPQYRQLLNKFER